MKDSLLYMRPRNWREFQHYHDGRELRWIKNYIELDDPGAKFKALSWADQGRLQALWRLAARLGKDGLIRYDEAYLRAALGDKRFPIASHLVTTWFHIGTQTELRRAAKRENRSSTSPQKPSLEVRGKKEEKEGRAVELGENAAGEADLDSMSIKDQARRSLGLVA